MSLDTRVHSSPKEFAYGRLLRRPLQTISNLFLSVSNPTQRVVRFVRYIRQNSFCSGRNFELLLEQWKQRTLFTSDSSQPVSSASFKLNLNSASSCQNSSEKTPKLHLKSQQCSFGHSQGQPIICWQACLSSARVC